MRGTWGDVIRMGVRKASHIGPGFITLYLIFVNARYEYVVWGCTVLFTALLAVDDRRRNSDALHARYASTMYMKPQEKEQLGASVYYFAGVLVNLYLGMIWSHFRILFVVGVLNLAFGDPAAWMFGRVCGVVDLYRSKTLGGFIGCFMVCYITSYNVLMMLDDFERSSEDANSKVPFISSNARLSLVGAVSAATTELFATKDNLFLPIVSSISMVLCEVMMNGRVVSEF